MTPDAVGVEWREEGPDLMRGPEYKPNHFLTILRDWPGTSGWYFVHPDGGAAERYRNTLEEAKADAEAWFALAGGPGR